MSRRSPRNSQHSGLGCSLAPGPLRRGPQGVACPWPPRRGGGRLRDLALGLGVVGHISDEAHASPALPLPPGHPAEAPCQTGYLPRRPQWVRGGRLTTARWAEIPGYTAGQEGPAWNSPHQPQAPGRSWTPPHGSLDRPPEHVAPAGGRWRGSPFLILVACIEVVWVGQVHQA